MASKDESKIKDRSLLSVTSKQSSQESKATHYQRYDPEPITVIEKWALGYHLGNVIKYVVRAKHKGTELRDLRKAQWYLSRWIELREAEINGSQAPTPRDQA